MLLFNIWYYTLIIVDSTYSLFTYRIFVLRIFFFKFDGKKCVILANKMNRLENCEKKGTFFFSKNVGYQVLNHF